MLTLLMLVGMAVSAQEVEPKVLDWENPLRIDNVEYTLHYVDDWGNTEIKFKRFTTENKVIETGTLRNRKPHGVWRSYDPQTGELMAVAEYRNGKRKSLIAYPSDGRIYTITYKGSLMLTDAQRVAQVTITGF